MKVRIFFLSFSKTSQQQKPETRCRWTKPAIAQRVYLFCAKSPAPDASGQPPEEERRLLDIKDIESEGL